LVALLVLCAVPSAFGLDKAPDRLRLATSKNAWCALTFIADEQGFFKEEKLDVELMYTQGGRYSLDALVSGSAEAANIVGENAAYYGYTGSRDLNVRLVIVSSTSTAVVARKSAGILRPEDISGKRLALSPATTSDSFAHRFIEKYGLKDVQILKVQPSAMQTNMIARGADAAVTWDPFISNIKKQLGADAIVFYEPASTSIGYMLLSVSPSWMQTHPQVVQRLENAYQRAADFAAKNPAEAQAIVARRAAMDLDVVKSNWLRTDFHIRGPEMALPEVKRIGEWIHAHQEDYQSKPLPDYSIYFDSPHEDKTK